VANLPFALDDDGLSKLFKDLKVTKAHVVKNRNQRSKGFGFVEFANEADQKAALAAAEKMVVDQRELIVKVALTAPEPRGDNNNATASSAAASTEAPAAAASPAPAAAKEAQPAKADDKSS
jgi:RNA recognition motif-containing protein